MKTYKSKIKYDPAKEEYILKIKKRCKPCWLLLLLLLLPLILLIPLKKDVKFKVLNSVDKSVVSSLNVNFDYTKRNFFDFDSIGFLTRSYPHPRPAFYSDSTDNNGIVIFKDIKYNVYQWLFRSDDTTRVYAASKCFKLDMIIDLFDLKDENIIYTNPILIDFEFTVVDADDNNEPLPDALVRIKSDMFDISDSLRSDNAGKVVFKQIPKCSNIEVIGSKYGWFNDTIKGAADGIFQKDDTLFLKQEKVIIKFFVKDLYTKKPLVNAHGQLFFESEPSKQTGKDAITNINGVAKGVFEEVHKIKAMRIDVNKNKELIYYNDTSTVDYIGYVKSEDWKKRTDEEKTIYLRPNPNPILFQDIDCDNKNGLANIENTVTIIKSNGTKIGPTVIISDASGNFSVSAGIGDKITISAKSKNVCPNEYISNPTAIVDVLYDELKADANKRKIPLCRVKAQELEFKNTDADTGTPLAGVTNTVNIQGGGSYNYTSQTNGTFMVTDVYECQIISITASKAGYQTNNFSVVNKKFDVLRASNPKDRIIPLKKETAPPPPDPDPDPDPTPIPVLGCEGSDSGSNKNSKRIHDLKGCDSFTITWDLGNTFPDEITIYCGTLALPGRKIFNTGFITGTGSRTFKCSRKKILIKVKANSDEGTSWTYDLKCNCL